MAIAAKVREMLEQQEVDYELVPHPHTPSSMRTAEAAHVPGDRLAKSVLLQDEEGYVLAVLPATQRLALGKLHQLLQRPLGLATEAEIGSVFADCETGALPALGSAYGITTIMDESLMGRPEIYFEAGDHEAVVRMRGEDFLRLMGTAKRASLSGHP